MTICEMYVTRDGRWQCGSCGHVAWSTEMASAGDDTLCPECGSVVRSVVDEGEAEGAEADLALRPCPFCGGVAEVVDGGGGAWRSVECGTCGARCRRAPDEADAARAWNTRGPVDGGGAWPDGGAWNGYETSVTMRRQMPEDVLWDVCKVLARYGVSRFEAREARDGDDKA